MLILTSIFIPITHRFVHIKHTKNKMVVETEKRRSLRPVVKRAPFQYPVQPSKYKPKPGFRHRASFRTKDELRQEILSLKQEIVILSSKLQASIKTQVALKRKLNFEVCPKIATKRKAEDGGENPPPKKVYKIGTSKNVKKNPIKRKSELCDNNDKSHKRKKPNSHGSKIGTKRKAEDGGENPPPNKVYKIFTSKNVKKNIIKRKSELCDNNDKPNSHVEKNSESNISLQDHLATVVEKATMSNKEMWDSLRLNEIDDDSVDDEVLIVPTTSTNNIESLLNNEQDDDIRDDIDDEVIFISTPEKVNVNRVLIVVSVILNSNHQQR